MSKRRSEPSSNTYRFFVAPDAIKGRAVQIEDAALAKQLSTVLRLGTGDAVTLLDNSGWEYAVTLDAIERKRISGVVTGKTLAHTEPRLKLVLYVALMRGERFEWVLQKGAELGVSTFVPVVCERSMVDDIAQVKDAKLERWQRIIREAAEQSRRAKLPKLQPTMLFATACDQAARRSQALLLWEGKHATSLAALLPHAPADITFGLPDDQLEPLSVAVLSGPEGGFGAEEVRTAQRYGIRLATLGPRTLRAETAPIAAASAIFFAFGDLG
jgi:16S rRNA (uracil1498-N3)-methyltransferase